MDLGPVRSSMRVRQLSLGAHASFPAKVRAYRKLLQDAGGRRASASISMCLSADAANMFCSRQTVTCASVRGNLHQNYLLDYGQIGRAFATAHLLFLRAADHVVVMTRAMADHVAGYTGRRRVAVIRNFIDEAALEGFRAPAPPAGPLRFVFLGSLTSRKQPLSLVRASVQLRLQGVDAHVRLIGNGPMEDRLRAEIQRAGLESRVTLDGFLAAPYEALSACGRTGASVFVRRPLARMHGSNVPGRALCDACGRR